MGDESDKGPLDAIELPSEQTNESTIDLNSFPKEVIENIFSSLDARDISIAANVSRQWRQIASKANWEEFYRARWFVGDGWSTYDPGYPTWHQEYSKKMELARGFRFKPVVDRLAGHSSGVKAVVILPSTNLLLSGSADRHLALWDLQTGTLVAASQKHAGTVRCIAVDDDILVTGSSDHRIRLWNRSAWLGTERPPEYLYYYDFAFDIQGERLILGQGHDGPVSSIALARSAIISGSWDCGVRVFDRANQYECTQVLHFDDWVTQIDLCDTKLYVATGHEVTCVDAEGGGGLRKLYSVHPGVETLDDAGRYTSKITSVCSTIDGRYIFYSTDNGNIYSEDTRVSSASSRRTTHSYNSTSSTTTAGTRTKSLVPSSPMRPHISFSSSVSKLTWEYPWLGASLHDGKVVLIDAEDMLRGYFHSHDNTTSTDLGTDLGTGGGKRNTREKGPWTRTLTPTAAAAAAGSGVEGGCTGGVQGLHMSGHWVVAGYEGGGINSWNFLGAQEAHRRGEQLKKVKRAAREERRKHGGGDGAYMRGTRSEPAARWSDADESHSDSDSGVDSESDLNMETITPATTSLAASHGDNNNNNTNTNTNNNTNTNTNNIRREGETRDASLLGVPWPHEDIDIPPPQQQQQKQKQQRQHARAHVPLPVCVSASPQREGKIWEVLNTASLSISQRSSSMGNDGSIEEATHQEEEEEM